MLMDVHIYWRDVQYDNESINSRFPHLQNCRKNYGTRIALQ